MALSTLAKGTILHNAKTDRVQTVEILLKGNVQLDNGNYTLTARAGAILGLAETPGMPYVFNYTVTEDAQVMSYAYSDTQDIAKVIETNQKIAPVLTGECVRLACEALNVRNSKLEQIRFAYDKIQNDYNEYPVICASLGEYPQTFEAIKHLMPPVLSDGIQDWESGFMLELHKNGEMMRKNVYALSPAIATGVVMSTARIYAAVSASCEQARGYEANLHQESAEFTSAVALMRAKAVEKEREGAFEGDGHDAPAIENALDTILSYAAADAEVTEQFRQGIIQFRDNVNRYASSDEARMERRALSKLFYEIYNAAFLRSRDNPDSIPSEVKMFFMFGFVDEVLAGADNTSMLYSMLRNYTPDPEGHVVTAYEWLVKIYNLEVEPSKNEFDEDYPTYLRGLKTSGDITEDKMKEMLTDAKERYLFEAKNFFLIGGRVTFGHAASFVPFFDKANVSRPLAKAYVNTETVGEVITRIRNVDYGLFSRQRSFFKPEIGINQLFLDEVVLPYFVLTPIIGCRGSLWQEIEGKDRGTPARMLLPIFHTEDLDACILQLSGDFRWEMCKTEQGVHWNDISDPSLTALYCDYLQFYKKNRVLTEDNKEKLKTQLKKHSNDYKKVFIADYITYVNFEAEGSSRMNKVAREIMFTFCPFPKELREKMADNPQYRDLIKKYSTQQANKIRPLAGLINRLKKDNIEVPEELMQQYQVLQS